MQTQTIYQSNTNYTSTYINRVATGQAEKFFLTFPDLLLKFPDFFQNFPDFYLNFIKKGIEN